jgi:hypothetical protein
LVHVAWDEIPLRTKALLLLFLLMFSSANLIFSVTSPAHATGGITVNPYTTHTFTPAAAGDTIVAVYAGTCATTGYPSYDPCTTEEEWLATVTDTQGDTYTLQAEDEIYSSSSGQGDLLVEIFTASAAAAVSTTVSYTCLDCALNTPTFYDVENQDPTAICVATGTGSGESLTTATDCAINSTTVGIAGEVANGEHGAGQVYAGTDFTLECYDGFVSQSGGYCSEYSTTASTPTYFPMSGSISGPWVDVGITLGFPTVTQPISETLTGPGQAQTVFFTDCNPTPASMEGLGTVDVEMNADCTMTLYVGDGYRFTSTHMATETLKSCGIGTCTAFTDTYYLDVVNASRGGVTGLTCGTCMVVGHYYNFWGNVTNFDPVADVLSPVVAITFYFMDGPNVISFSYDNKTGLASVDDGGTYIQTGSNLTLRTYDIGGGVFGLYASVPVVLLPYAITESGIDVTMETYWTAGSADQIVASDIDIINPATGPLTSTTYTDNATSGAGEGQLSCTAFTAGTCAINATSIGLVHYQTSFSIQLSADDSNATQANCEKVNNTPLCAQLWQTPNNAECMSGAYTTCNEYYTDGTRTSGEHYVPPFATQIIWYAFDNITGKWVDLFSVALQLSNGNEGGSDEWTTLQANWYNGETQVQQSNFTAWIDQGAFSATNGGTTGAVQITVDMWLSDINGSTVHGGRVAALWTGMHSNGYLWWTSWSPTFENDSSTINYETNYGSTGEVLPAQEITCSKIGYIESVKTDAYGPLNGGANPVVAVPLNATWGGFAINTFQTDPNIAQDGGVTTPNFIETQVPDLPSSGFLTPLFNAISALAGFIWGALSAGLATIWAGIGARFPWFTAFWGNVYAGILTFSSFFFSIFTDVLNGVTFAFGYVSYLAYPIGVLGGAFGWLQQMFSWLPTGTQTLDFAVIIILWVFSVDIITALNSGDTAHIVSVTRGAWRIAREIMYWTYMLATEIINQIVGLIP